MVDSSEHFSRSELVCKCGCNRCNMDKHFLDMLEKLRERIGKPIIVTSGFRCPTHSVNVGGYANDAHTKGFACDITVAGLTPYDIAEQAELCGFTGIGIMNNAVHVDTRSKDNYVNSHWFGNEITGDNNIKTFIRNKSSKNTASISIDGKKYKITIERE